MSVSVESPTAYLAAFFFDDFLADLAAAFFFAMVANPSEEFRSTVLRIPVLRAIYAAAPSSNDMFPATTGRDATDRSLTNMEGVGKLVLRLAASQSSFNPPDLSFA